MLYLRPRSVTNRRFSDWIRAPSYVVTRSTGNALRTRLSSSHTSSSTADRISTQNLPSGSSNSKTVVSSNVPPQYGSLISAGMPVRRTPEGVSASSLIDKPQTWGVRRYEVAHPLRRLARRQQDPPRSLADGDVVFVDPRAADIDQAWRAEERRVGKECRSRWSP